MQAESKVLITPSWRCFWCDLGWFYFFPPPLSSQYFSYHPLFTQLQFTFLTFKCPPVVSLEKSPDERALVAFIIKYSLSFFSFFHLHLLLHMIPLSILHVPTIYLYIYLSIYLSIYLFIFISLSLYIYIYIYGQWSKVEDIIWQNVF